MITKAGQDALRSVRPTKNSELRYTIGGAIETQVHSNVEAERIGRINRGDRRLQEELEKLRQSYAFSTREGLAKAHFNSATKTKVQGLEP